jgi:glycosyltransferase involved in cell wall biosynthesis
MNPNTILPTSRDQAVAQSAALVQPHTNKTRHPKRIEVAARAPELSGGASVILPAYNEAEALPIVLSSIFGALAASGIGSSCEVIVVDDGSTDATAAIASQFPCRLVVHEANSGKGAAVRTGLAVSSGDFIIIMDADATYPAEAIPHMIRESARYDLVRGVRSRDETNMPTINRIGNVVFDFVLNKICGLQGQDHLSGLYGMRRSAIELSGLASDGFDLEVEIGIKARALGLRVGTFPIEYRERVGEKKLRAVEDGWRILHRLLGLSLTYRWGPKLALPGLVLFIVALAVAGLGLGHTGPLHMAGGQIPASIPISVAWLGLGIATNLVILAAVASLRIADHGITPGFWARVVSSSQARLAAGLLGVLAVVGAFLVLLIGSNRSDTAFISADSGIPLLVLAGLLAAWGAQTAIGVLTVTVLADQAKPARMLPALARSQAFHLVSEQSPELAAS